MRPLTLLPCLYNLLFHTHFQFLPWFLRILSPYSSKFGVKTQTRRGTACRAQAPQAKPQMRPLTLLPRLYNPLFHTCFQFLPWFLRILSPYSSKFGVKTQTRRDTACRALAPQAKPQRRRLTLPPRLYNPLFHTRCLFLPWFLAILCLSVPPISADQAAELRMAETVETLSNIGSRITGYPGSHWAADELKSRMQQLGITRIYEHRFDSPFPLDEGFQLEADGTSIRLYGVWPNLVRTPTLPPGGIDDSLVYGGNGDLKNLQGDEISGRIVVLDYVSGSRWVTMFHLGAKAVIFLDALGGHRKEGSQKFLDVPADLPRFYAHEDDGNQVLELAERGATVHLEGKMSWQVGTGRNLVGIIEGTDPTLKKEAIFLNSHYDAMSPIPALAPGAEQACSPASLLEIVRQFSMERPKRTVIVVFSSGHFENLAGIRHFVPLMQVAAGVRPPDFQVWKEDEQVLIDVFSTYKLRMFIGFDLVTESDLLSVTKAVFPYRTPFSTPPINTSLMIMAGAYEDTVLGGRKILANGLKKDLKRQGLGTSPESVPLEASAPALAGCPTLLFRTLNDIRSRFDSPTDYANQIEYSGLGKQVQFLSYLIPNLVNDPKLQAWEWGNDVFSTLRGEVMHYGARSYLPDQPTSGALVRVRRRNPTVAGVRGDFWAVADDSGRFEIPGLETTRILYTKKVRIEAYGLDPITGAVTDAPDWGVNGERRLPERALKVLMDNPEKEVQVVTTQVAGLTIFETFDPRNLMTPERVELIEAGLEAEPPTFGACLPLTSAEIALFGYKDRVGSWVEPTAVLFVKPGTRLKAVMSTGLYGLGRRLLLLNGSPDASEGLGYPVDAESRLPETVYRVASDMTELNEMRVSNLNRFGVNNRRLSGFHEKAQTFLAEAQEARENGMHQRFLDRSRLAWSYAATAYQDVASTQGGVIQGALFLLGMLIPFAHFAERLVLGYPDLKRQVFGYFGFFLLGFVALRYLHPAFELSISPIVILLGFIILTLGLLVTSIGIGRLNRELQDLASGRRGRERSDLQRSGTFSTSVAVGLSHLRRRPLRTALTCATLVLLTFSVLFFTSIRATLRSNHIETGSDVAYEGVLIRLPGWKTMEMSSYYSLVDRYGSDRVAPRAWVSEASIATRYVVQRLDRSETSTEVLGIVGLSALESQLVGHQRKLKAGRWLNGGEDDVCLLPESVADSLGVRATDLGSFQIRIFGESFTVVGLLEDDALEMKDVNGESITPLHPEARALAAVEANAGTQSGQLPAFDHLRGSEVIVLPFQSVMRWEKAVLSSIGLLFEDAEPAVKELSEILDLNLYAGLKGKRYLINTVGVASVSGLGDLIVPIGIAALIILNTMMGAVYERTREIGTFNAVGLAPKHVSGLFMAEASAYAVVGGVLGYVLGQTAAQTIGKWGLLAGLELNYSSLSAVLSLGLVMGVVMLSAIYPARMAGKICTPGIERRWAPPRPTGDLLIMELPFTLVKDDALGMGAFLAEFWDSHQEQSIGAGFYVEALTVQRLGDALKLQVKAWLAPFDQGVMQDVVLEMEPEDDGYYTIKAEMTRTAGDFDTWSRVNRTFLDDLRKQFLVWRTLLPEDRKFYLQDLDKWIGQNSA